MEAVSRRGVLLGAGALVTATLTACAPRAAASAPAGSLVMIVRHAEKPPSHGAPHGVTAAGERDDDSLTVTGWTRAGALVGLFDPVASTGATTLRPGLARPVRVLAADPSHGSKRPAQTVTPLAARLGTPVVTTWRKGQENEVAAALDGFDGVTLVAWEHEAIPAIVAGLGAVSPRPPSSWPGDRFDLVWTFTRTGGAWRFAEVPQLLLAGDSASPA